MSGRRKGSAAAVGAVAAPPRASSFAVWDGPPRRPPPPVLPDGQPRLRPPLSPEAKADWAATAERRALARWLADGRLAAGLTQAELGRRIGRAQSFVARMESATGPWPRHEHLAAFAAACGRRLVLRMEPEPSEGEAAFVSGAATAGLAETS